MIQLKDSELRGDRRYVQLRRLLIPDAERIATEQVKKFGRESELRSSPHKNGTTYSHCFWTEFFMDAMDNLTKRVMLK